jgi:hypothetical protein
MPDRDEAEIAALERALARMPEDVSIRLRLMRAYADAGYNRRAFALLTAQGRGPLGGAPARALQGRIAIAAGEPKAALDLLSGDVSPGERLVRARAMLALGMDAYGACQEYWEATAQDASLGDAELERLLEAALYREGGGAHGAPLRRHLVGCACTDVARTGAEWIFRFGDRGRLVAGCPWRIRAGEDGDILLGHADHGRSGSDKAPIDGVVRARHLLGERPVTAVWVQDSTGDLAIAFEKTRLEVFNVSRVREAWTFTIHGHFTKVAMGGGGIVERSARKPAP